MQEISSSSLRSCLKVSATTRLALASSPTRSFRVSPTQRYPDPSVLILLPRLVRSRIFSSAVEQGGFGMRRTGPRIARMQSPASLAVGCALALPAIA